MGTPQISTPEDELGDVPPVRTTMFRGVPYLQILRHANEPVLDLTLTDALNLAMLLIEHAGEGMNRRLANASVPSARAAREPAVTGMTYLGTTAAVRLTEAQDVMDVNRRRPCP